MDATKPGGGMSRGGGNDLAMLFQQNQPVPQMQAPQIQQPTIAPFSMAPTPPQAQPPAGPQPGQSPMQIPSFRESNPLRDRMMDRGVSSDIIDQVMAAQPEDGIYSSPGAYAGFAGTPSGGQGHFDANSVGMQDHNATMRAVNEMMRRLQGGGGMQQPAPAPAPSQAQSLAQQMNSPANWQRFK